MNYKRTIKISTVLLLGILSIIALAIGILPPSATPVTVAQKHDSCDNFKILSPIGSVDMDVPTYFSWTAVDEADEYILMIVDYKGKVVEELHLSSEQTWIYYTLKSIQFNTKITYKIYAQKKAALLCTAIFEPVDPKVGTYTPIWESLTLTPTRTFRTLFFRFSDL